MRPQARLAFNLGRNATGKLYEARGIYPCEAKNLDYLSAEEVRSFLVAAEEALQWDSLIGDRRATLSRCDSIIATLLAARAPEVIWVPPAELRHVARRAPGIAADPDQLGTPFLRASNIVDVPDPLRYELRTLMGLVGGRYVMVPAGLVFRVASPGATPRRPPALATAELSVVLIDSRIGKIGWRTIAHGEGDDPWTALTRAVKSLTPGLP